MCPQIRVSYGGDVKVRRFIATLPGKVISNVLVAALVLPYMLLGLSTRANAQLRSLPQWAVVDFVNMKEKGTTYGAKAAEAISGSLSRTGKYDVQPIPTVARVVESLGLSQPLPDISNVLRVASEMKVQTVVKGEIAEYRIDRNGAGKQARVSMRAVCYDVASGLPVNGAAVSASSIVRASDVSDEVLINDAIGQAASLAVSQISSQTLPTGTVLNTSTATALINSGSRSGFAQGMRVIITRGRQQVASGELVELGPDRSTIKVTRSELGIQPGDKVRAIFDVPMLAPTIRLDGQPNIVKPKPRSSPSGFVTTLLVVGLAAMLVGGKSGGDVIAIPISEAYNDPTNGPSVRISWKPNGFAKGKSVRQSWQIFRNDLFDQAAVTVGGSNTFALDNSLTRDVTWSVLPVGDLNTCNGNNQSSATGITGVVSGRPYQYQVQLVFALSSSDLGSGGSTGTTAGTGGGTAGTGGGTAGTGGTTGGPTTGGTTGGTTGTTGGTAGTGGGTAGTGGGTTGATLCFFVSDRTNTIGYATPIAAAGLIAPSTNSTMSSPQVFTFNSVTNPLYDQTFEYILHVSSTLNFTKSTTFKKVLFQRRDAGTLASDPVDLSDPALPLAIRNATKLYWRIGAKNVLDVPGPVQDPFTGDRYIFSTANQLNRPGGPPPPPSL